MIKCIAPNDPTDERLWKAYLEKHGCQVVPSDDHYGVTLPSGSRRQRIGGELEPGYRWTLPDGAILIVHVPRMRENDLVALGLPEDDWKAWKADNEKALL